jgi:hypothetical protein
VESEDEEDDEEEQEDEEEVEQEDEEEERASVSRGTCPAQSSRRVLTDWVESVSATDV